jgi:hypothetical protein
MQTRFDFPDAIQGSYVRFVVSFATPMNDFNRFQSQVANENTHRYAHYKKNNANTNCQIDKNFLIAEQS